MRTRSTPGDRRTFLHRTAVGAVMSAAAALLGCAGHQPGKADVDDGANGTLMLVGGALDPENHAFYERFIEHAARLHDPPRIVICAVPSGEQIGSASDQMATMRAYRPDARIEVVRRETLAQDAVKLIDECGAVFFTGGDQSRVTAKYRPGGVDGPEALALRRLLARNGTIAGTSAGCALMGDIMFTGGDSASALGIARPRPADSDEDAGGEGAQVQELGPRLAPGMGFLQGVITDSHFFERDRIGRLVAAMEQTGTKVGLGVGENACVEVDVGGLRWRAVGPSASLVVIADDQMVRKGAARHGLLAYMVREDEYFYGLPWVRPRNASNVPSLDGAAAQAVPVPRSSGAADRRDDPHSGDLFAAAVDEPFTVFRMDFDGWSMLAGANRLGVVAFDIVIENEQSE